MLKKRRLSLNRFFEKFELDALLISDLRNIRYLCGFSGSEGALLLTRSEMWFLCDSRYTAQAGAEVLHAEIRECVTPLDTIAELAVGNSVRRIGFDASTTTVSAYRKMVDKLPDVNLVELGPGLDEIRSCKDSSEIELLQSVATLSSVSLAAVLPMIQPGVREDEFALQLEFEMRRRGAEGRAFDFIVASGVRGAMPHGRASDKQINSGELITIDFGALKDGYHSDETVTVACGRPAAREQQLHDIVRAAHDLAIESVTPGISCRALDAVAREYIQQRGYGDFFGHGLGHGVGLAIHEKPTLSPRSEAVLEEGMVITIEPGIYIPGFGGVRIEDTLVVTSDGYRILTGADKNLLVF
jgi:Xaa-Pro aminopeptidase